MVNWCLLIDKGEIASVLPDEYARFRRPILGALSTFLESLPARHQAAVLADQAALPPTTTAAERLFVLARGCPVLHKLGQILARDHRLSLELRQHLQGLESLPPSTPLDTIQAALAQELGPLDRLGVTLGPLALAEASVAVVIPFREGPRQGVFKVLKPGIEERLEQELAVLDRVGSYLDERCRDFGIPHLDYEEAFGHVRVKLRDEIRLDLEQRHLAQARAAYDGEPRVLIPALFEHCTARVTAMERVRGVKVTEHSLVAAGERRRLADLLVKALIAQPIFAKASPAVFHGDPHAGNLFLTDDHRLAVLDWSLVGALGEPERVALVQVLLAALTLDADHVLATLEAIAERPLDRAALRSAIHARLRCVRRGRLPGLSWLLALLDEAAKNARLRVGADLLLFRKALHTLQGVEADIGVGASRVDVVLLGEFLGHLAAEWPQRWLALPGCRAFATRLSNADLARLALGLPWAGARCWTELVFDLLRPGPLTPSPACLQSAPGAPA